MRRRNKSPAAVTSKGSETFSKSTLTWDLKVKSKVLASTKKK